MISDDAMSGPHFNKHPQAGQSGRCLGAFLCFLAMFAAGCTSIYHRTRADLPVQPADEVQQRVAELRQAADEVQQAGRKLQSHLRQGKPAGTLATDFDRLEVAGHELERRALTALDLAGRQPVPDGVIQEAGSWLQAARAWLDYVNLNRDAAPEAQRRELDFLLGPTAPGPAVRD